MTGTALPLPPCAFVSCKETALHSTLLVSVRGTPVGPLLPSIAIIMFEFNEEMSCRSNLKKKNRQFEKHSCYHYCSVKAINFTYSECMFVGLGVQHAMRMGHIVVCGLPFCSIFSHIFSQNGTFFEKIFIEFKMCFDFL
jgi:hypothetical protein